MTRTEERLTDALTATADSVHEHTLRPLVAPPPRRHRRPVAWLAPIAAAAAVLLVIGLAVVGRLSSEGGGPQQATGGVPRYFVSSINDGKTLVVRSVAAGAVTATVPYPAAGNLQNGLPVLASARNGTFFAAVDRGQTVAEQIYRFQVTAAGEVSGFAKVTGGLMPHNQDIDAIAASPDGSMVAIGLNKAGAYTADQIVVIHTATGAKTVWNAGALHRGQFSVSSLSWTADGHELAVLGQWCEQFGADNENCFTPEGTTHRTAEVWGLNPASGGGQLGRGHLLARQSGLYTSQAVISPDGSVLTEAVLTTARISPGIGPSRIRHRAPKRTVEPGSLVIRQISVATGRQLRVLYRHQLPRNDTMPSHQNVISLSPDSSGRHWMISAVLGRGTVTPRVSEYFNGWIRGGRVVPLPGSFGNVNSAAW